MALEFKSLDLEEQDNLLAVHVTGKLEKADYENFVPTVEKAIQQYGKIRILFDMHDFHGWSAGALWEDVKFDLKHFADIEKLALVGDKAWEKGMATFCKPFTSAKVKFFERSEFDAARDWLIA